MSDADHKDSTPDLSLGIAVSDIPASGLLAGHVGDEAVLLAKSGAEIYAIGATCSHYGAPLAEGLIVGDTLRCPWHHACFSLKAGTALRPPALKDLACWRTEQEAGRVYVRERLPEPVRLPLAVQGLPASIVIIGAGAAGNMAAETLRREGYEGPVTLIGADPSPPYDRPVLSKDYLAGHAPEDWVPLRSPDFYAGQKIDLRVGTRVTGINLAAKRLHLQSSDASEAQLPYDALLLATGATPVRLDIPGADLPHVHVLRTLADCNAILADIKGLKRCVIVGASFIGLEVASALRQREMTVHVVAPDRVPMARIMGETIGQMVLALHKSKGVVFHLETKPTAIRTDGVMLANGDRIAADLVIVGIGVRPALALAQSAGLAIDRGVLVDDYLQTSVPGIYAAGDIARWPDPHSGNRLRVEHWIVAERQGQVAARNMLGRRERFDAVPFFWSQQYDSSINYVGHAEDWDDIKIEGDVPARDFVATFSKNGKKLAVVSMGRDRDSLLAEWALEKTTA